MRLMVGVGEGRNLEGTPLIAVREMEQGKYMVVVYREKANGGFIITAQRYPTGAKCWGSSLPQPTAVDEYA